MKAHFNGITIEGTPQEIAEYQRLQREPVKTGISGLGKAFEAIDKHSSWATNNYGEVVLVHTST